MSTTVPTTTVPATYTPAAAPTVGSLLLAGSAATVAAAVATALVAASGHAVGISLDMSGAPIPASGFPEGRCDCGDDLGAARDLGVVDRYQQHEIPQVAVTITQYDQHQVALRLRETPHRHPAGRGSVRAGRVRPTPTWPRSPSI